jgi:hypothetical protein
MQIENEKLKKYIDDLTTHLNNAFTTSQIMQTEIQNVEGDSELFRKLSFYLTPNLNHWINGVQAGNIKDLESMLNERIRKTKK